MEAVNQNLEKMKNYFKTAKDLYKYILDNKWD